MLPPTYAPLVPSRLNPYAPPRHFSSAHCALPQPSSSAGRFSPMAQTVIRLRAIEALEGNQRRMETTGADQHNSWWISVLNSPASNGEVSVCAAGVGIGFDANASRDWPEPMQQDVAVATSSAGVEGVAEQQLPPQHPLPPPPPRVPLLDVTACSVPSTTEGYSAADVLVALSGAPEPSEPTPMLIADADTDVLPDITPGAAPVAVPDAAPDAVPDAAPDAAPEAETKTEVDVDVTDAVEVTDTDASPAINGGAVQHTCEKAAEPAAGCCERVVLGASEVGPWNQLYGRCRSRSPTRGRSPTRNRSPTRSRSPSRSRSSSRSRSRSCGGGEGDAAYIGSCIVSIDDTFDRRARGSPFGVRKIGRVRGRQPSGLSANRRVSRSSSSSSRSGSPDQPCGSGGTESAAVCPQLCSPGRCSCADVAEPPAGPLLLDVC